jgi:hypothetical protein
MSLASKASFRHTSAQSKMEEKKVPGLGECKSGYLNYLSPKSIGLVELCQD